MNQGNLQLRYLNSVMDVYELVFQKSSSYTGDTATKVKQEILHGLGNSFIPMNSLHLCSLFL